MADPRRQPPVEPEGESRKFPSNFVLVIPLYWIEASNLSAEAAKQCEKHQKATMTSATTMKTYMRQLQVLPGTLRQVRVPWGSVRRGWRKQVLIVSLAVILGVSSLLCGCAAMCTRTNIGAWSGNGMEGTPYRATLADFSAIPKALFKEREQASLVPFVFVDLPFSVAVDTACLPVDLAELRKK